MMRALRADKFTIAALAYTLDCYINSQKLPSVKISTHSMISTNLEEIKNKATFLSLKLSEYNILNNIVKNQAQCEGGTLPETYIPSYAVKIDITNNKVSAKKYYHSLLKCPSPVVGILKKGEILFDVTAIDKNELEQTAKVIAENFDKI